MNIKRLAPALLLACAGAWAQQAPPVDPPLIAAIKNGQLATVQSLLSAGQSAAVVDSHGYTAVMYAVSRADAATVSALLAHGGSLPADTPTFTSLIEAAKAGKADIVKLLLGLKANVNARDGGGATALLWTVGRNRSDAADALLAASADVSAADTRGQTALISASQLGLTAMVKKLLAVPALRVNDQDRLGYSALMWAAHNGRAEIITTLLAAGADPKVKGKDGLTAAAIAKARGFTAIAQVLPAS